MATRARRPRKKSEPSPYQHLSRETHKLLLTAALLLGIVPVWGYVSLWKYTGSHVEPIALAAAAAAKQQHDDRPVNTSPCIDTPAPAFDPLVLFTDTCTGLTYDLPDATAEIHHYHAFPLHGVESTEIVVSDARVWVYATRDVHAYDEWAAGVPLFEIASSTNAMGALTMHSAIYDALAYVSGAWQRYGSPFKVVYFEKDGMHYLLNLSYESEEQVAMSDAFLASLDQSPLQSPLQSPAQVEAEADAQPDLVDAVPAQTAPTLIE